MNDSQVNERVGEDLEPVAHDDAGFTEAEVEHFAQVIQDRVKGSRRASEAYNMAAWFAMNAATRVRYGVYTPEALVEALRQTNLWMEQAGEALLALGDVVAVPGSIAAPAVLYADLAATRTQARDHLNALAAIAASHAHLLDAAPDNIPALLAIGRSLTEEWYAAQHALIGMGATLAAIDLARGQGGTVAGGA